MSEDDKSSEICIYLYSLAYKILVEENPSNYNKNMLDFYLDKMNNINLDSLKKNEINAYLGKTLNINKG